MIKKKLKKLRKLINKNNLEGYIIPKMSDSDIAGAE